MVKYSIDSMSYILSITLVKVFWSKINFHQTLLLLGLGRVKFLHVINVSVTDANLVP